MLTVGDVFPDFSLTGVGPTFALSNPTEAFSNIRASISYNKWLVVVAWPKDFTFICPTEILSYNDLVFEFSKKETTLLGLSTDSDFVHMAWRQSNPELSKVTFPWLADNKRELSSALGILHPTEGVCLRATFIVDPLWIIRHVSVNELSVGRNPEETLRVLTALQNGGLCPCSWQDGDNTLTPFVFEKG